MKLLAGLFAIAFACVGAPALAQGGDRMMTFLDFADLRAMAAELDFTVTKDRVGEGGEYYLELKSDAGLMFSIYGMSCSIFEQLADTIRTKLSDDGVLTNDP